MNETYKRQLGLIGEDGQAKLAKASILIVGAGGIGNIAAKYLASSGVGHLTMFDPDIISQSNLNRQLLFNEESIGRSKVIKLKEVLHKINSNLITSVYTDKIQEHPEKFVGHDIVLDCTDNMESSYFIEEQCLKHHIPLVFAKTSKYFGVVTIIKDNRYLRNNYPTKQLNKDHSVFPPIGGVIGSLQAGFAIKLILGLKVDDDVVHYDFLNNVMTKFEKANG